MTKKDAILNAALELLVEKGVHNTPMSQIAKAAGTGMGTIYNYFPNKDILINEIYVNIKEQDTNLFLEVDAEGPLKTSFENYMTVLINFFLSNPSYFNFLQQLEASPIITEENRGEGRKSVEMVASPLGIGQRNRIIKNMEIKQILLFIGGAITSYLQHNINTNSEEQTSLTDHVNMVWDGIKG